MTNLEEFSRGWERDGEWRVAPAGVAFIACGARIWVGVAANARAKAASIGARARIGAWARIGARARIGDDASIGAWASIGASSSDAIDLGFADGYHKCIAQVDGVAYIGAGCRWFTLAAALKHWGEHPEDRNLTMCLMQGAIAIAGYKGWRQE